MSMNIACFIIGAIFGVVGVIIIACCSVASDCDREEEGRKLIDTMTKRSFEEEERHNRSQ